MEAAVSGPDVDLVRLPLVLLLVGPAAARGRPPVVPVPTPTSVPPSLPPFFFRRLLRKLCRNLSILRWLVEADSYVEKKRDFSGGFFVGTTRYLRFLDFWRTAL